MKFAVITHAYNEGDLLPQFMRHYERMGADIIHVIHDRAPEMDDGRHAAERTEMRHRLDGVVDYVILPDVDEFILPFGYDTITAALEAHADEQVFKCTGYCMVHHESEPPYDPALPIVGQRKWGYTEANYDKPIVLAPAFPFAHYPGFHSIDALRYRAKPGVFALLHMVAIDEDITVRRKMNQANRHRDISRAHGWGVHNWDKTEEDQRAWHRETCRKPELIKVLN